MDIRTLLNPASQASPESSRETPSERSRQSRPRTYREVLVQDARSRALPDDYDPIHPLEEEQASSGVPKRGPLPPWPGRPCKKRSSIPSMPELPPGTNFHKYCVWHWEKTRDARRNFCLESVLLEPEILKQLQHLRYNVRSFCDRLRHELVSVETSRQAAIVKAQRTTDMTAKLSAITEKGPPSRKQLQREIELLEKWDWKIYRIEIALLLCARDYEDEIGAPLLAKQYLMSYPAAKKAALP